MEEKQRINYILEILAIQYPRPRGQLEYRNPFELLVAAILSAQTTDKQVNQITRGLFKKYPAPADFLSLTPKEIEEEIKRCGLFRNKGKNILETCRLLVGSHGGEVPRSREELEKLPGVGRKTASVVLANAFGIPAFPVDTHVHRVSVRLGLSRGKTPRAVEKDLRKKIPRDQWNQAHHWLIFTGREYCRARRPRCQACPLIKYCPRFGLPG